MATKPLTESGYTQYTRREIQGAELQVIERAHEAIVCSETKVRKGWTQGSFAKDGEGKNVVATSKNAVAWCALGAVRACAPRPSARETRARSLVTHALEAAIAESSPREGIVEYNDTPGRKKSDVVGVFRRARTILKLLARERGIKL